MPINLLDSLNINNSYIFLMHYDFYFKDFDRNNF